jgi:hypothetical protein
MTFLIDLAGDAATPLVWQSNGGATALPYQDLYADEHVCALIRTRSLVADCGCFADCRWMAMEMDGLARMVYAQ